MRIYIADDHLLLVEGELNVKQHSHLFLHLIINLDNKQPLQLEINGQYIQLQAVVLDSHIKHLFKENKQRYALILIDPTSHIGRCINECFFKIEKLYKVLPEVQANTLNILIEKIIKQAINIETYQILWQQVLQTLGINNCYVEHRIRDDRVVQVIQRLSSQKISHKILLSEVAKWVYLSPSRFSHLFKAHTGNSLKGYLLFKQILIVLTAIAQGTSITEAALLAGFDTPSHLSATCRKIVGIQPSNIYKVDFFLKIT